MTPKNDNDIQIALMPAPMDGPSENLVRKLRVLGQETPLRTPWWRSPFIGPATVAATFAAIFTVTTMLPAKASAKSFDLIVAAAQNINAFQFTIHSSKEAKPEAFTIAGTDSQVFMHGGAGEAIHIEPTAMSIYDPKEQKVTRFKFPQIEGAKDIMKEIQSGIAQGLKEMDLKKMLAEYRQKYGSANAKIGPVIPENGHLVYHVWLSSPEEPERVEMTVNASSDLPERLQVDSRDGTTRWRNEMTMELRFGANVDRSLLHSSVPAGVKVEEIDINSMMGDALKEIGKAFEDEGNAKKEKP